MSQDSAAALPRQTVIGVLYLATVGTGRCPDWKPQASIAARRRQARRAPPVRAARGAQDGQIRLAALIMARLVEVATHPEECTTYETTLSILPALDKGEVTEGQALRLLRYQAMRLADEPVTVAFSRQAAADLRCIQREEHGPGANTAMRHAVPAGTACERSARRAEHPELLRPAIG